MRLALLVAFVAFAAPCFAADPVPLFDGKTLAGWDGDTKTWRVEDGAIVGGSLDAVVPRNEFLCTTKTFGDFELRVRFKLVGDRAKANAGVQIRTKRIPNHHEVSGYQADVGQDYWGALYDESRRNKVLAGPAKEDIPKFAKFDDWNDYVIRCEGPRIRLWLNGTQTVDYVEKEEGIPRTGIIGLQIHGGAKAKAFYKDIRIEELPAKCDTSCTDRENASATIRPNGATENSQGWSAAEPLDNEQTTPVAPTGRPRRAGTVAPLGLQIGAATLPGVALAPLASPLAILGRPDGANTKATVGASSEALASACAEAPTATNWPAWRGPNADGAADPSADPPTTWDGPSGKNVKWKAPLPGEGSSTPIVWGDRIFVLSAVKTDREASASERPKVDPKLEKRTAPPTNFYRFLVTCFDRNTGEKKWEQIAAEKVPHEGHHSSHSYCAGSPATDGERLYCCFGSFGLYCYDLAGKPLWSRDLGRINSRLGWGEAVTPVVHGDALVLNWDQETGSALFCLDAKTGETKWRTPRTELTTWNTPLVTEYGGKTQVIVNGTTRVRSYDLADGKEVWNAPGTTVNPIPSPLRFGDAVIVMGGYQSYVAESIPLGSSGTVSAAQWRHAKGTPYVPSPVLVGDRLYFNEANKNTLTVLDAKTGKPVIEREPLPGVTSFYASPLFAGGRVYFVDRAGTTVVLKPGDSLDVIATNKLGDPVDASPIAVGKQLFLRGEKQLWCIE